MILGKGYYVKLFIGSHISEILSATVMRVVPEKQTKRKLQNKKRPMIGLMYYLKDSILISNCLIKCIRFAIDLWLNLELMLANHLKILEEH